MKSILISIRPEWVAKILNGKKTLEIRKTVPKCDLPIDVYIYCTEPHAKEVLSLFTKEAREYYGRVAEFIERKRVDNRDMLWSICNGKVVAKFTLKSQSSFMSDLSFYDNGTREILLNYSCLSEEEIKKYANGNEFLYAWEISDLVIFDKPKELSEFKHPYLSCGRYCGNNFVPSFCRLHCSHNTDPERLNVCCDRNDKWGKPITKAPQSWCHVEVRE